MLELIEKLMVEMARNTIVIMAGFITVKNCIYNAISKKRA